MWRLFEHIHVSVMGNIICLYSNCDYTQPVWEQISNTNQFIQKHTPRVGVQFQHTPYVCILKSSWHALLAVSEMLTDHIRSSLCITTTHRRAKALCAIKRASVCKHAVVWAENLCIQWQTVAKHLSLRDSPQSPLFTFAHLSLKQNSCWDWSLLSGQCACGCTHL